MEGVLINLEVNNRHAEDAEAAAEYPSSASRPSSRMNVTHILSQSDASVGIVHEANENDPGTSAVNPRNQEFLVPPVTRRAVRFGSNAGPFAASSSQPSTLNGLSSECYDNSDRSNGLAEMAYPLSEGPTRIDSSLPRNSAFLLPSVTDGITAADPRTRQETYMPPPPSSTMDLPNLFDDSAQVFSQFDWGWEGLFASQAATPNFQNFLVTTSEDLSPAGSILGHAVTIPARSVENVTRLGDNFVDTAPWSVMSATWRSQHFDEEERFENVKLTESTRERMLAIAQIFFRLALDSLNVSSNPGMRFLMADMKKYSSSSILSLPPTPILHTYLETFLTSFEPFYPLVELRTLDPNTIAKDKQEHLAMVLILLMTAYGAMRDSAVKARRLSMGLLEICRLTLLHFLDKDSTNPRSSIATHCALLSTYQSAFSGDKWLMSSSLGQMHQYLILSRHSRIFETQPHGSSPLSSDTDVDTAWESWRKEEYASRLAYSWVMVDQEISLFHDSNPMLTIPELERNLPDADELWLAPSASTWADAWQKLYGSRLRRRPVSEPPQKSLPELFQFLLENKLDHRGMRLQVLHLRLLLYPTHILIAQLTELNLCISEKPTARFDGSACHTSSSLRFNEIKVLLRTWWEIFSKIQVQTTRQRAVKQLTQTIYHLLNLRLTVSFIHLEQHAREARTNPENLRNAIAARIFHPQEAIFHCGQILRITREMESELQPLWWPATLYRVTIILWTLSFSHMTAEAEASPSSKDFAIDTLATDDKVWQPFLKYNRGRPCLIDTDGIMRPMTETEAVLRICVDRLGEYRGRSYLAESLILKLESLSTA
ncbi:hypothetical protein H2200_013311 [Cladophialophora chaetospira]|uniref:Transcription factor domain-containing protein n=1 Tax=Cladophialophora chaetospira TaxID=386627 RepID=A0AA38WW18_9EURO|nr:hypothetical protein H2200_013311 [Cladophialophora chaetospira]